MRRPLSRLRWQLTLSHLIAIAFTLMSMIAAVLLIASGWIAAQTSPAREPAQDARMVAQAVGGLAIRGGDAQLNGTLRALADGSLRVVVPFGLEADRRPQGVGVPPLRDVSYLLVLGPNGQLIASSDPAGAAFAPPEAGEWRPIAARAMAGGRGSDDVVVRHADDGPAALAAAPILGDDGRPAAAVVVGTATLPQPARAPDLLRGLAIFGAASIAVLAAASVFALGSAGLVAYLLSRRLVTRLERLGAAVESLAAGNLAARAPAGGDDEVGQLVGRFNHMAVDLERTLHELEAERDRVTGLLMARRQLVAGVSHELRTPVATVRGYLEAALGRDGAVSADLRADLEIMEGELERLQRLIDDLFTLSRAEVGQLELRSQPMDVGVVVQRLVETLAPLAWQQRRVQMLVETAGDLPPARGDAQRLEQVVSNLLSNAVRHTPPGGLVAAAVRADVETVRLEVRDTGSGIAPADLPHVFERFYRGPGQDGRSGAGLGLALVKELTETMGGRVEAASTPGEGTCFTVRLPRA